MGYSVGQVAGFAGVTVRTLHHYDEIGLLTPSGRTSAGYRRYEESDLERLQQIMFYRELGFPLEEIATLLDDPGVDALAHLRRQHRLLTERLARLRGMVAAVEHAMEARQMGISLTPEERFEVFGDFRPEDHEEEARRRWGGTDAYRESQRRVAGYDKATWLRIKEEAADVTRRFAEAMAAGVPADSERSTDLAEEHRQHITRWFYDCSHEIHEGLGEMYVADERFRRNFEVVAAGLAEYVRDAIRANAARVRSR
ncbi:transcriptional regulator [Streptoalloteichus tenebrarius]|uniref:Transcriptional regulator n=1 Tax=Streptoalloteichus tenebrarius (strain ATCC 17920 / DSM 40477 / JCM 4838 / CBS 697.72 / NBRC 16177 / NCIMB 11028 / NRRL B-12390 / A12253. 1 / ISP 5477) TaxID=1933 RepID=A0ABT1HR73_STRSD|nr:MerR family transcriptional regulator [Streptoalloteichus tenebrarius]MCP2257945.1 transcriptional regulator [Streptoalloteichus tenebrarius]BFF01608.1 MerR family transcriptional regulator [Streptoalloteichus tenebrarius]